MLLGIDIGTTNSKVGLFDVNGTCLALASRETETLYDQEQGYYYYRPETMWRSVAEGIREVMKDRPVSQLAGIGITSMAESGLLLDRRTGEEKSYILPWFDTCSQPQADRISQAGDAAERFRKTGLTNSFKLGLAKILWLRDRDPNIIDENTVWLSASGYIAYRLSGELAFDYSLAARTYAFRIDQKKWDADWLKEFGLTERLFPDALPAGTVIGKVRRDVAEETGLTEGIPVVIGGHDHVCAALAVGAIHPGTVYDSMGTAETLVGTLEEKELGEREFRSGLSFGCHIAPGRYFWMGGNPASGGSVEWLRPMLSDDTLSYEQVLEWLTRCKDEPTGILYFPYLSGSGAPVRDSRAKAAFIGLVKDHHKGDLIKAVLEGTSYQLEAIREEAEQIAGHRIERLLVIGGGTRNRTWLQIKADVLNCELDVPSIAEATLMGAAMAAGWGAGVYASVEDAVAKVRNNIHTETIRPRPEQAALYRRLYEHGFAALQAPLRQYFHLHKDG